MGKAQSTELLDKLLPAGSKLLKTREDRLQRLDRLVLIHGRIASGGDSIPSQSAIVLSHAPYCGRCAQDLAVLGVRNEGAKRLRFPAELKAFRFDPRQLRLQLLAIRSTRGTCEDNQKEQTGTKHHRQLSNEAELPKPRGTRFADGGSRSCSSRRS
jgi:hypothetical protein